MKKDEEMLKLVDAYIREERETEPNPFLSTRIMAAVDSEKTFSRTGWQKAWQWGLVTAGILLAVAAGIVEGTMYQPIPREESYTIHNDSRMENFEFYNLISNE